MEFLVNGLSLITYIKEDVLWSIRDLEISILLGLIRERR